MSEPSTSLGDSRERQLKLAAVAVGVLAILYGVLIAGQILAPIALFAWVFVVYLLWRFVRAHERLADAAEQLASDDDAVEE
jgi:DMSO/TMAO reductase YedYZ heme-binding membrane subunit